MVQARMGGKPPKPITSAQLKDLDNLCNLVIKELKDQKRAERQAKAGESIQEAEEKRNCILNGLQERYKRVCDAAKEDRSVRSIEDTLANFMHIMSLFDDIRYEQSEITKKFRQLSMKLELN